MAEKQLQSTLAAASFQKQWFGDLRRRVFDERRPYALIQADVPFELFDLLDIPAVSNQWWSSLVAAKRQAPAFLDAMAADGVPDQLCRYCSLGLATTRYAKAGEAPWGGLPQPRLLCARLTCDCIHRVFSLWAEAFDTELFEIDNPGASELPPRWWELTRHRWRELIEPHRLTFVAATLERLIERLESIGARRLDRAALRERLERVNRQEEIFDAARRLIASAPATPVRMTEQIANVMATQWVRGTDWALAHAQHFYDELRERVDAGIAAYPGEKRAAHVGRRGAVARHGFLYCVRGLARRRLRVVDVSRFRSRTATFATGSTIRSPHSRAARRASTSFCTTRRGRPSGSSRRRASIASTRRSCCTPRA